jgi:hypothetical protein
MAPELRLVKGAKDDPDAPLATFCHDARLPVRFAQALGLVAIGCSLFASFGPPPASGPRYALFAGAGAALVLALWQLLTALGRSSSRYTLTSLRLDLERGLITRRQTSVELWRVRDVVLDQSLLQRLRGAGTITVFSTDQVDPALVIGPVAQAKERYAVIRDAAQAARRTGRVVTVER